MPLLEMNGLSFAYPGAPREVLRGIDLAVDRGEVLAVVGPNGAGKSTLLRLASGMLSPTAGSVRLDGTDLSEVPRRAAARRIAGVAAADEARFPFTVEETVALGRHPWRGAFGGMRAEDAAAVEEALDLAEVAGLRDRPLPRLSSGERQRAAAARCLAQGGDLVLLDEPTAHLDLGHRTRLLAVFRRRARDRKQGLLAVLHDLNLAAAVADRMVLLVDGRVAASGPPAEVLTREVVRRAFGAEVGVLAHPATGAPVVVPEPGDEARP